jgi:hypothetical protein
MSVSGARLSMGIFMKSAASTPANAERPAKTKLLKEGMIFDFESSKD